MPRKCMECGCTEVWDQDCGDCDGSGTAENGEGDQCEHCEGTGTLYDWAECSKCGHVADSQEFEVDQLA